MGRDLILDTVGMRLTRLFVTLAERPYYMLTLSHNALWWSRTSFLTWYNLALVVGWGNTA